MLGPVGLINRHDGHWFESHNLALFFGGSLDLVQVARRATAIRRARRFTASRPKIAEYAFGLIANAVYGSGWRALCTNRLMSWYFGLRLAISFRGSFGTPLRRWEILSDGHRYNLSVAIESRWEGA